MDLFHIIDEAIVITVRRGIHRQAKVYRRGDRVFTAYAGGFVRLLSHGETQIPDLKWLEIEGPSIIVEGVKAPRIAA